MQVQFDSAMGYEGSTCMRCPACGHSNLHHARVEIFDRKREDGEGLHTKVASGVVTIDNDLSENPSTRRGGLKIYFWCEHCSALPTLSIYQHKGCTLIEAMGSR